MGLLRGGRLGLEGAVLGGWLGFAVGEVQVDPLPGLLLPREARGPAFEDRLDPVEGVFVFAARVVDQRLEIVVVAPDRADLFISRCPCIGRRGV